MLNTLETPYHPGNCSGLLWTFAHPTAGELPGKKEGAESEFLFWEAELTTPKPASSSAGPPVLWTDGLDVSRGAASTVTARSRSCVRAPKIRRPAVRAVLFGFSSPATSCSVSQHVPRLGGNIPTAASFHHPRCTQRCISI